MESSSCIVHERLDLYLDEIVGQLYAKRKRVTSTFSMYLFALLIVLILTISNYKTAFLWKDL
jgi:hypothetical protein